MFKTDTRQVCKQLRSETTDPPEAFTQCMPARSKRPAPGLPFISQRCADIKSEQDFQAEQ